MTDQVEATLTSLLQSHDHVEAAWLFGSVARSEAAMESDLDVAAHLVAETDRPSPETMPEAVDHLFSGLGANALDGFLATALREAPRNTSSIDGVGGVS